MSKNQASALSYYVLSDNRWQGPFTIPQIRELMKQGKITPKTSAYEPQMQEQLAVSQLIADGESSRSAVRPAIPASAEQSQAKLDVALSGLNTLRQACQGANQGSSDRAAHRKKLHAAHSSVGDGLREQSGNPAQLRNLVVEIDKAASEVANRRSDGTLTHQIERLRKALATGDAAKILAPAETVLQRLYEHAESGFASDATQANAIIIDPDATQNNAIIIDPFDAGSDPAQATALANDEAKPSTAQVAVENARVELGSMQDELAKVQDAYRALQDAFGREKQQARQLLIHTREMLESEQKAREGDIAELRGLAAEIYHIAYDLDEDEVDDELSAQVQRLGHELKQVEPTSIVPVAEHVLAGIVGTLRVSAARRVEDGPIDHQELDALRARVSELSGLRAELLEARATLSLMRQREEALAADKAKLKKQLEEARQATDVIERQGRMREQQLRSTVNALEVSKQLHQQVMEDLQDQLREAQTRVEGMEQDLDRVRDELRGTRSTYEARERELQARMTELAEQRGQLEDRRSTLSASLQAAESELQKARTKRGAAPDDTLTDALAARVNQFRQSLEQTRQRLAEQEQSAGHLADELAASRREADDLRTRSDDLHQELGTARASLDSARRRMEELAGNEARLAAEREALKHELEERRAGDPERVDSPESGHLQLVIDQLEQRAGALALKADSATAELERERARADALAAAGAAAHARIADLTASHERLRGELAEAASGQGAVAGAAGSGLPRIAELEALLAASSRQLAEAAEQRNDIQARLLQSTAERERLNGELLRLRSDQEAGSVEHRAAIAAARQRLGEQQAHASTVEGELALAQQRISAEQERLSATQAELDQARAAAHGAGQQRDEALANLARATAERQRLAAELAVLRSEVDLQRAQGDSGRNELVARLAAAEGRMGELARQARELQERAAVAESTLQVAAGREQELRTTIERQRSEAEQARSGQATALVAAEQRAASERERVRELEARAAKLAQASAAAAARNRELDQRLAQALAERAQLAADLERLVKQLDGAASEQGAASAQLAAEQERAATATRQLAEARQQAETDLAAATRERERLAVDFAALRAQLIAERDQRDATLVQAQSRLVAEQARIQALEPLLEQARAQTAAAVGAREELGIRLAQASAQRDHLAGELERLRAQAEHTRGAAAALSGGQLEGIGHAEQALGSEHERLLALAGELAEARAQAQVAGTRTAAAEAELAKVVGERDRLRVELEQVRRELSALREQAEAASRDHAAGLARVKDLEQRLEEATRKLGAGSDVTRRRLQRAAARIARLKHQLEEAAAQRISAEQEALDLRARFDALHATQRAAAEALGAIMPGATGEGSGTRATGIAISPADLESGASRSALRSVRISAPSGSRSALSATRPALSGVRTVRMDKHPLPGNGFTSAFGRPRIPTGTHAAMPAPTQATVAIASTVRRAQRRWHPMRPLYLGLATGAAILAFGFFLMPPLVPYSVNAVVNADLAQLSSPIEGKLRVSHGVGEPVALGQVLSAVRNDRVDTSARDGLVVKRDNAQARLVQASQELALEEQARIRLTSQLNDSRARLLGELGRRLDEDQRELAVRQEALIVATAAIAQAATPETAEAAKLARTMAETAVAIQQGNIARTTAQLDEVRNGRLDAVAAPVASLHLVETEKRLAALRAQDQELVAAIAGLAERIAAEDARLANQREAVLVSPIEGSIYNRQAADDKWVKPGEDLLTIADHGTLRVEAILNQRYQDDIALGDGVDLHLQDEQRVVRGTVRLISRADREDDAAQLRARRLTSAFADRFKIVVAIDPVLAKDIRVGQDVKLIVTGTRPGLVKRTLTWIYEKTKL